MAKAELKNGNMAYSLGYTTTAALAEHAKNVIDGKCEIDDFDAVMATFAEYTPGAGWNGATTSMPMESNRKTISHLSGYLHIWQRLHGNHRS